MPRASKDKRRAIADESPKTRRAREKLQKQLDAVERKITPQALEKKAIEIHRWIERHANTRVALKTKNISLFDENQNAAAISHRINSIAEQLKQDLTPGGEASRDQMAKLKGMVTKLKD